MWFLFSDPSKSTVVVCLMLLIGVVSHTVPVCMVATGPLVLHVAPFAELATRMLKIPYIAIPVLLRPQGPQSGPKYGVTQLARRYPLHLLI